MARTTAVAVKAIIEVDEDISDDLAPFIETANELVTELCAPVATYTSTRLELIERWLAAHFYAIRDPRAASENASGVGASYQHQVGLNLNVTTYGQQAMILDTAGALAVLNKSTTDGKRRAVGALWLGTETPSDPIVELD